MPKPSVIVIGGGVAGLAAAAELCEGDAYDVTLFEAQDRLGGRVHSVSHDDAVLELGAQWIHGRESNPVADLAQEWGLLDETIAPPSEEGAGIFHTEDGKTVNQDLISEIREIVNEADSECTDLSEYENEINNTTISYSVEDIFRKSFNEYLEGSSCEDEHYGKEDKGKLLNLQKSIFHWFLKFHCLDNSCYKMSEVSAATWDEYIYLEGEKWINFKSGYGSFVNRLKDGIPKEKILLGKCVKNIDWACSKNCKKKITVACSDGTSYQVDHVIITVSLGYLKQHVHNLFTPSLPNNKLNIIKSMGFGTLNKIYLVFERPFWDSNTTKGFQLVWKGGEGANADLNYDNHIKDKSELMWYKDITGFDIVLNQPSVLVGWIGRKGGELMETLSDEEISNTCTHLLKQFTGYTDIPKPKQIIRSSWKSNPYIKGSYSYRTIESDKLGCHTSDLAEPLLTTDENGKKYPAILFAGEATQINYFSTVHGAFLTGQREAKYLHEYYNN